MTGGESTPFAAPAQTATRAVSRLALEPSGWDDGEPLAPVRQAGETTRTLARAGVIARDDTGPAETYHFN